MAFSSLFKPIKIRGMELKNRVIFPAMATNLIAKGGYVTERLIDYHVARVLGGNGLSTTEAASVHTPSAPSNFLSISDDKFNHGLKKFTDAIRAAGGKSCVQLWQGGIVAAMSDPPAMVIVPSDMKIPNTDMVFPAATVETIKDVVKAFGEAAKRAYEVGFDCVEFHAGHGYSPHSFLSGAFNKRTDEYGGSLENRARYNLEIIEAIRSNIPEAMPLLMRIVAHDDYVENGLTIEETIEFCKMSKKLGVDLLNVSRGNALTAAVKYEVPPIDIPKGFNVDNAARIKKETGMLTAAVGRINDPQQADSIISSGQADMVVLGRAQIADPDFCIKAQAGREDDIVRCIACNQGCVDRYMNPEFPHLSCLRNPAVGREKKYFLVETRDPKKVLIVGGGMAGLEAAFTLKQRGHNPILCEESDELGGQFLLAGLAPRKEEMRDSAISRGEQVLRAGVDVRLNTKVSPELIEELNPDIVIIATGAEAAMLDVPGIDLEHVYNSHDVLSGRVNVEGNIVVVGGGLVGLEVAEYIACDANNVTVIEMLEGIGREFGSFRQICVLESIHCANIITMDKTKCVRIKDEEIIVERDGEIDTLKSDYVIIAIGSKPIPYKDIEEYCKRQTIPYHVIGDAFEPRRAIEAIAEGADIARKI